MKEREYGIEERLAGLVQPDTLLPSQYFDRIRRRGQYDGERRLTQTRKLLGEKA